MTIVLGTWTIPALITLAAILWLVRECRTAGARSSNRRTVQLMAGQTATIVSLAAWLAWSIG